MPNCVLLQNGTPHLHEPFSFSISLSNGTGGSINKQPGNVRLHDAKRRLQPQYKAAPRDQRTCLAQQLVNEAHAWGGRFLKRDEVGYYEVHNLTARTKCSQMLREDYTAEKRREKRQRHEQRRRSLKALQGEGSQP